MKVMKKKKKRGEGEEKANEGKKNPSEGGDMGEEDKLVPGFQNGETIKTNG